MFILAIMPLVEQVAPYMEKLEKLKQFAEVDNLNELTHNKDRIIKLGEFQKLQYERAEKLGKILIGSCWRQFNYFLKIR